MRLFLVALASLALSGTSAAQHTEPPQTEHASSGTSLEGLLRPDGLLDIDAAVAAGSLDLSGYDVSMTPEGLRATEIMPGIDPERDIVDASGGRVRVADDAITLPLSLLRDEPMGWGA